MMQKAASYMYQRVEKLSEVDRNWKTAWHTYDLKKYNIEHLNLVFMLILGCLQIRNYALLVTPVMLLIFDCIDKWTFCYNPRASYHKSNLWCNTYFEISKYNMVGQVKLENFAKYIFFMYFRRFWMNSDSYK